MLIPIIRSVMVFIMLSIYETMAVFNHLNLRHPLSSSTTQCMWASSTTRAGGVYLFLSWRIHVELPSSHVFYDLPACFVKGSYKVIVDLEHVAMACLLLCCTRQVVQRDLQIFYLYEKW
jgi:hypothetical protein